MILRRKWVIVSAIILGLTMGLLWFKIGEEIDGKLGNFVAWWIAPFLLPLIIAATLFFIDTQSPISTRALNSAFFFVVEFLAHWIPMVGFILLVTLSGGM